MQLRWAGGPGLEIAGQDQLDDALDALLAGPALSEPLVAYLTGDAGALGLGLDPDGGGLLLAAGELPGCVTWEAEPGAEDNS